METSKDQILNMKRIVARKKNIRQRLFVELTQTELEIQEYERKINYLTELENKKESIQYNYQHSNEELER
ncbi:MULTISPECIES: hypothetical protein [Aerococcus]|uniref:Uncharacterized protein n=2 Tax=Aerococcus TaxID=1375 RepID=A0A1E9PJ30_9LACT|nr:MULTISPECIES: hypothetical protein [Aerococcus]MBU5611109.1 hypothetical protein [Aerococcus urinae]MCY3034022.1 hypothetical protein [Aerococcus mictus]MCY3065790.1 hypothetical protein [Aerococcus mictus]MCY3066454.1 hypothetical protein [Aerococcus mictus]MCY3071379.1 hypothetical protein [Aerococcus mictus]